MSSPVLAGISIDALNGVELDAAQNQLSSNGYEIVHSSAHIIRNTAEQ